jgi:tRNA(adenine34) deaminase
MTIDERFMDRALKEARRAADRGEVPVGAVIVKDGCAIALGYNRSIQRTDPTAHAEVVAIRAACRKLGNYRLSGCTLYVTIEPCAMCLGAAIQARLDRLVFGALDPKAGAVSSIVAFPVEKTNHRIDVLGGILAEECGRLLRDFFRAKRV